MGKIAYSLVLLCGEGIKIRKPHSLLFWSKKNKGEEEGLESGGVTTKIY